MGGRGRLLVLLCILVAIGLRLWRINAPFDDEWSWRQSDVAAIARNYFENGFHFSMPQIDWAGDEAGFVGTEFPLLPFTAALLYKIFGVHEWIGRALTILFFAVSLPIYYILATRYFSASGAVPALFFYAFSPLMLATSRAFMPDVPSLSCGLAALLLFCFWLNHPRPLSLARLGLGLLAAFCLALALLLKPTTATIGAAFLVLSWKKFGWGAVRQPALWCGILLALAPSALWYWHAQGVAREFYPHHMFGAGGAQLMNVAWYARIFGLVVRDELTPVLFVLAVIGIVTAKTSRDASSRGFHNALLAWLTAMLIFVVVVGYGNRHEWYRLALVPIAAALGAAGLNAIAQERSRRYVMPVAMTLFAICSALSARQYVRPISRPLVDLGRELQLWTPRGSLIVVADNGDPSALYYAHRKGWHFLEHNGWFYGDPASGRQLIDDLELLRRRGATHLAFYNATSWWLDSYSDFAAYLSRNSTLLRATPEFRIYKLNYEPFPDSPRDRE